VTKVNVLSSGSCGNATLISDGKTRILIDAGISRPTIDKRLAKIGEDSIDLNACLLTHEHTDHMIGLRGMISKYQIQTYCTEGTYQGIEKVLLETVGLGHRLAVGEAQVIGTMAVLAVDIPHDSNQPVGYLIRTGTWHQLAFVTDLAYIDQDLAGTLAGCDFLFLEANHDIDGLKASAYPEYRKKRVRETHLCNDQVCDFLRSVPNWRSSQHIVLGHLSEGNNNPDLVYAMARRALREAGPEIPQLTVLPHGAQSKVFEF
jgi:phosphoribosyl 1,2-cyclic phosphodiesterase